MLFAPIDEVKIYRNSAVIRRKTTVALKKGTNEITLFGLSRFADSNSLRLFFSDSVTGKDVQIVSYAEAVENLPSEALKEEIDELQAKILTLRKIESLWLANGNLDPRGEFSTETIERYLDELPARLEKLRAEQKELQKQIDALWEKKRAHKAKESFQVIRVILEAPEDFESVCEIEYLDKSARWKSSYEIHVDTDSSEMKVVSRAGITQNADEDWENVRVLLCTGSPSIQQNIPVLKKQELRFREEDKKPSWRTSAEMRRPVSPAFADEDVLYTIPCLDRTDTVSPGPPKELSMEFVEETDAETMTIYRLPGRRTIPAGIFGTMADLKTDMVSAELCIVCVPKLDTNAYLVALIKSENWPLKPTLAKIYLNKNYCGEANIAPNLASEEVFMISLGKDERISSNFENSYSRTENLLFKGQKRNLSKYVIRIGNLTDNALKVLVWDQIPVSSEKQISIESVSADGATLDHESGKLSWSLTIEGKKTVEKHISYSVSYPKDKVLSEIFTKPIKGLRVCQNCSAYVEGMICPKCGSKME